MRVPYWLHISIILLIAAAIPSCKSPISPTSAGPTLTLILPDSARALDSLTLRAHYSDSIKPTWGYAWQFGDSTKASAHDTAISHIYDSAGTYTVQVALTDTALHQTITKQTGQIKIMPLNAPTLTLTVSDTNYWGDSCVMSVSSSQPLKAGWKFSWSLGDSSIVTGKDSVLHYYLTPGIYKVTVSLYDTVHHILLVSKSAIVPVVPRHFSLALLQSMREVEVIWNAQVITDSQAIAANACGQEYIKVKPTIWAGNYFSMVYSYGFNYQDTMAPLIYTTISAENSINGNIDSNFTRIVGFSTDTTISVSQGTEETSSECSSNIVLSVQNVPFKNQSDSEIVFEAEGNFILNPSYRFSLTGESILVGGTENSLSYTGSADWSNKSVQPYIIVRFRK